MDMPDTVTSTEASASGTLDGDYDDAAGYYTPGAPLVDTFDVWWLTLVYLVAMLALGAHLHHGIWSAAQTLGWTGTAAKRARAKTVGFVIALIVTVGFSLVPLAVIAGIITK